MVESTSNFAEALLFDLDGTLFDSLPGIAFSIEQAFATCNMPKRSIDLRQMIGPPIRTILSFAAINATNSDLDYLEGAFRKSYDSEGWQRTTLFAGARDLLREAHSFAIPLFVVSNKPRQVSLSILAREGVLGLFTAILTRDSSDPHFTGKAQMIESLLDRFQLHADRCLMIGDTAEDAHAAAAMHVPFAWVAHGYGKPPACVNVAHSIDSFTQLLPKLIKEFTQ